MKLALKSALYRQLRQIDLKKKYEDMANFVRTVELDRTPVPKEAQRVAILAPHPDDESLGCGGTIRHFVLQGTEVTVLYLTGGEYGLPPGETWSEEKGKALRETRRREATQACAKLGANAPIFLGGIDTQLYHQLELANVLCAEFQKNLYDHVFCPWPFDAHTDHAATFRIFQLAVQKMARPFQVWLYEVWNPLLANRFVNIDATLEAKTNAIAEHRSQSKVLDFKSKILALSQYRSLSIPGAEHAEAFFVCPSDFIRTLRV